MWRAIILSTLLATMPAGQPGFDWSAPRRVQVGTLIGRTPDGVQRLMAGGSRTRSAWGLEVTDASEAWAFTDAFALLQDDAAREQSARWRSSGEGAPRGSVCDTRLAGGSRPGNMLLAFRNGRLASAWDGSAIRQHQQLNPSEVLPANLPTRLGYVPISPSTSLLVRCRGFARAAVARHTSPDVAGAMQGLALLPFAVTLPFKNAGRQAAKVRGEAIYATLVPGRPAPADIDHHPGVQAWRVGRATVLVIDMGAYPNRNLTHANETAMAATLGGRVVWRARAGAEPFARIARPPRP